ncbi:rubredoxin [Candidatus Magnetomonas plexicatena]|nr:rubredoxin [Nitrospirales bacterium LBB_01]
MHRCTVCGWIYDDAKESMPFDKQPDDYTCPVCNAPKEAFEEA